jgi:riboflavin biosynthesis pyrimidine reductase
MEQITTLLDRHGAHDRSVLPEELKKLYDGDLQFPARGDRPYVVGNFVSSLDGVVSFEIPGKSGGGEISGFDKADRFIMGLLRASADAVMVGSGTLRDTPSKHLWIAEGAYPEARELYAQYRQSVLQKPATPLNVIVSRSGTVDLQKAVFRTPGLRTLIVTSNEGKYVLAKHGVSALESVLVRECEGPAGRSSPPAILELLRDEFGVKMLLHEGGPALFGEFVGEGCMDELFLTVAPQLIGRGETRQRPGLIAGIEFLPDTAPWMKLASVKQSGEHLYLRLLRSRQGLGGD